MLLTTKDLKLQIGRTPILKGVTLELPKGTITGLLGPNGSGKTTTLKVIAGLLRSDEGEVEYPHQVQSGVDSKKTISFMPDQILYPEWMKVKDAFHYYEDLYPDFDAEKGQGMMELMELDPQKKIKKLSKGMQERLTLCLVFSRKTDIYLLDEPLGGIDPVGKSKVLDAIVSLDLAESAVLLSTHLVKDVETIFDRVYFLQDGQIVYQGDCEQMREEQGQTVEQVYLEVFANGKAF